MTYTMPKAVTVRMLKIIAVLVILLVCLPALIWECMV